MPGHPTTADRLLAEAAALRALARSLVADPSHGDDVVQDAYLAALRQGVDGEHTGRWLTAVTRRLALLLRRREHRRKQREARAARAETTASAADVAATAELLRSVATAVHELDEPFRTAIVLRFWHQLPPRAIAARTGVPSNTVRSRIQRGLARLRLRLDGDHGDRAGWAVPLCGLIHHATWPGTVAAGGLLMGTYGKIALAACAVMLAWLLWPSGTNDAPVPNPPPPVGGGTPTAASIATARTPDRRTAVGTDIATRPSTPVLVVTGTLVDEETLAPLRGADVRLLNGLRRDARDQVNEARAESAYDGTFRVEEARAGVAQHAELLIDAPNRATFRHSVPPADAETTDRERAAAPRVVDVGRVLVPPGTGVRGTVVDAAGAPVPGAGVFVSTYWPYEVLPALLELDRTDAAGFFAPRRRIVPVTTETLVVAVANRGIGWTPVGATRHRSDLDVVVRLRPAVRLDVDVRDAGGAPLSGAAVRAEPRFLPLGRSQDRRVHLGHRTEVIALFTAVTGTDGGATLPYLPLGEGSEWGPHGAYDLVVEAEGHRALRERVTLSKSHESHTLRLVADVPVAVDIRVVDAERMPVAGARVTAGGRAATTDANGTCRIDGARAADGTLFFRVAADGFLRVAESRPVSPEHIEFALAPAAVLDGVVVDQYGLPVLGARVFVDGPHRADSGADGTFRVEVPTGELTVAVFPPEPQDGWAEVNRKQVHAADGPLRWVLERLAPGITTLSVEVVDMVTGAPADPGSGTLHVIDQHGMMAGPFHHSAERRIGYLRHTGLRPGRYKLTVAGRVERIVEVSPDDVDVRLRVEVGAPGVVLGEVVFDGVSAELVPETVEVAFGPSSRLARWVEPPGGKLLVYEHGGIVRAAELAPAAGTRFRLEDVDPHQPLVLSVSGRGVIGRATVRAAPGRETPVVVHVGIAGRLQLRFEPRCPAPSIRVRFRGEAGEWDSPRTLEGVTELSGTIPLRVGRYRWQVAWDEPGAGERTVEGDVTIEPRGRAQVIVDFETAKK